MKFNTLQAIGCGNATRIIVEPTAGESRWRIMRKETNDFSGASDPAAFLVHDGVERFLTDARLLVNGVTYFYAIYGRLSTVDAWAAPVIRSIVPSATFDDVSVDVQELVRERLDLTLNNMIARGSLKLTKPALSVMSIPFHVQGGEFPVVSVLFAGSSPVVRSLGNSIGSDVFVDGAIAEMQGYLSSVTVEVLAWSLNAQERNLLRKGMEAAVAANLSIFDDLGLQMFEVQSVQDSEDMQSMNVPVYQTTMRLGCTAAVAVTDEFGVILGVEVGGTSTVLPDGTVLLPDGKVLLPDGTVLVLQFGTTMVLPDGMTSVLSGSALALPNGTKLVSKCAC